MTHHPPTPLLWLLGGTLCVSLGCEAHLTSVRASVAPPPTAAATRLRVKVSSFKDRSAPLVADADSGDHDQGPALFGPGPTSETLADGATLARTMASDITDSLTLSRRFDVTPVLDDCDLLLVGTICSAAAGRLEADLRLISCFNHSDVGAAHVSLEYGPRQGVLRPTGPSLEAALKTLLACLPDFATTRKGLVTARSGADVTITVDASAAVPQGLGALSVRYPVAPSDPAAPGLLGGEVLTGRLWIHEAAPGTLHATLIDGAGSTTQPGDYVLFK